MSWPRKIIIESTALFQGSRLQKPELANLLERRDCLKFHLLVSEVSWLEYLRQRKRRINALLENIDHVKNHLGEWDQDVKGIIDTRTGMEAYLRNLEKGNLGFVLARRTATRVSSRPTDLQNLKTSGPLLL